MSTVISSAPPYGLVLKLRRARKQLRDLRRSVTRFTENRPCTYRRVLNQQGSHYVYSLDPPQADEGFLLMADEAVHHMRTVLDHLVVACNRAVGGTGADCSFPIWKDEPRTDRAIKAYESSLGKLASGSARAIFDELQPYKRGNGFRRHPLWILSRLDNKFKHESLHLLSFQVSAPTLSGAAIQAPRAIDGLREHGDAFAAVPIAIDVENDFEPYLSVSVAFRIPITGLTDVGIDTLDEIYDFVRSEVVGRFVNLPKIAPVGVQNPIGGDRGAKIGDDDRPEVGMRLYFILLLGLLRRVLRSRDDLLMENLVLRQQLAVYARRPKRPRLQDADRLFWSAVARTWGPWRSHLQLVRPGPYSQSFRRNST